jgi:hypothetical protein
MHTGSEDVPCSQSRSFQVRVATVLLLPPRKLKYKNDWHVPRKAKLPLLALSEESGREIRTTSCIWILKLEDHILNLIWEYSRTRHDREVRRMMHHASCAMQEEDYGLIGIMATEVLKN